MWEEMQCKCCCFIRGCWVILSQFQNWFYIHSIHCAFLDKYALAEAVGECKPPKVLLLNYKMAKLVT